MKYQGWNYEKTLLIRSTAPEDRLDEFIDVQVAVETVSAGNLQNDVRVVFKPAWNRLGRELPSQVYNIQCHGAVTTFRVAFLADIPAHRTVRIGILYDNPQAAQPRYETDLEYETDGHGQTIENGFYRVATDPLSGQIDALSIKLQILEYTHIKQLTVKNTPQPGVTVHFADPESGRLQGEGHAGQWRHPDTTIVAGPLFYSMVRRGRLAPCGQEASAKHPMLEVHYKFLAGKPYFLQSTRLEFSADTPVNGIDHDLARVDKMAFSHYCFRPVTPTLAATDLEEAGHILVAPEYIQDLPEGNLFGGFLPYDLAWYAFISTFRKQDFRFDYALSSIRLAASASAPNGTAPAYRPATYVRHDSRHLACSRSPVYVRSRNHAANIITVPAGTVYQESTAWHLGEWDEHKRWLHGVDALGRRLHTRLEISQHPVFLGGEVPAEPFELVPVGHCPEYYTKAGVR